MDSQLQSGFSLVNGKWVVSVGLSLACLLCCVPQGAMCLEPEAMKPAKNSGLKIQFDELEALIEEAEDPVQEARQFLITFLADMETEFGIKLSLADACEIVKKNIHLFGIPEEEREGLLLVLEIFATEPSAELAKESKSQGIDLAQAIHFGWNSRAAKKIKPRPHFEPSAGSLELFTGALLCMIPHQQAHAIGNELIQDGCNR